MVTLIAGFEDRVLEFADTSGSWARRTLLDGHRMEAVAAHPDDPQRLLVGTRDAGLHRSADGGESWERVGHDVLGEHVSAIASDPTDPDRFYAGTEPSRVYATGDAGSTWTPLEGLADLPSAANWAFPPRPSTHHVRWIEVDPSDPDRLYVAVEAGALLRSFDGGETWVDRVPSGPRDTHSMAMHPDEPGRAWAAAGDGFAVTEDGGDTWTNPEEGLDHRYCWSVVLDPGDPERALLSAASGARRAHTSTAAESYVYRWADPDADSWELAGAGLPHGDGMLRPVIGTGTEPQEAWLVTNLGVWETADFGSEWQSVSVPWPEALESQTVRGLTVIP